MRKLLTSSAALAVLLSAVSLGNIGGCSNNLCSFTIANIYNGASFDDQESQWNCRTGGVEEFSIAFYADGTGQRSDLGDFVWDQTACRRLEFTTDDQGDFATLVNLSITRGIIGGDEFGTLKYKQNSDDLGDFPYTCDLEVF